MRKVAVIGGGWAGFAAAVELCACGDAVTVFESARTLGGRARQSVLNGHALDNGQHILLGAYAETLRLMHVVGIDPDQVLLRLPLQMRYAPFCDGMDFTTPRLPAPLHMLIGLLRADGLRRADKLALARFSSAARWMGWQLDKDCSVAELLDRFDQTERLTRLMWRPLCIAALNTPPHQASARVFLSVLRDSLGSPRRSASDMLLPRRDLSTLFPLQAAAFVERHGGSVHCGVTVKNIRRDGGWRLTNGDAAETEFDAVVVATQPTHAAALLDGLIDVSALSALEHEPITTCYLRYPADCSLGHPMFALLDDPESMEWGQFVFDRGMLDQTQRGMLAVVISASDAAIAGGHEQLAQALAMQLAKAFRRPELAQPEWARVVTEKRATFSCVPDLKRPPNETGLPGLALAGDYTASDYPATLETAMRSGVQAAACL